MDKIQPTALKNLLKDLFPIVSYAYQEITLKLAYELYSLCDCNSFDTYFRLSVPGREISREFYDLLSKADSSISFGEGLDKYVENGKIIKLLKYLQKYSCVFLIFSREY